MIKRAALSSAYRAAIKATVFFDEASGIEVAEGEAAIRAAMANHQDVL